MSQIAQRLEVLHTVARALSTSVQLEQVLGITLQQVAALLGLETGWIFLLNSEQAPYLAASQNLPEGLRTQPERLTGSCYCLDLFRMGQLTEARNIQTLTCSRLSQLQSGSNGLRFHASIPLQLEQQRLGVMNVASQHRTTIAEAELETLYTIGDLLSLAIQRSQAHQAQLELTGLQQRYHLARELHDSLGQSLTAMVLRLESLDILLEQGRTQQELRQHLAQTLGLARANIQAARQTVEQLRAEQALELSVALRGLAQELVPPGKELHLQLELAELSLTAPLSHALFRVAQELLTNVIRHAQATQVQLSLSQQGEWVVLGVKDNGKGFVPERVPAGHYGLLGIRERMHLLGGHLQICSEIGRGSELQVCVPRVPAPTRGQL